MFTNIYFNEKALKFYEKLNYQMKKMQRKIKNKINKTWFFW